MSEDIIGQIRARAARVEAGVGYGGDDEFAFMLIDSQADVPRLLAALDAVLAESQKLLDSKPMPGTEKTQEWYSLGKRHAAERMRFEMQEAIGGRG